MSFCLLCHAKIWIIDYFVLFPESRASYWFSRWEILLHVRIAVMRFFHRLSILERVADHCAQWLQDVRRTPSVGSKIQVQPSFIFSLRGGFQQNVSSLYMVPLPLPPPPSPPLSPPPFPPPSLHSGSDSLAGVFPLKSGWPILIMTNARHNWMDHDCGKTPLEHMRRSLTGHHTAPFPVTRSPCSKDRSGPEEGRGG